MGKSTVGVFGEEVQQTIRFAAPIVLAQVGFMLMGVVDTIMVGRLDASSLAGTGFARSIFWIFAIFAMGILSALDTIVSQTYGAKNYNSLERLLYQSLKFCFFLSLIISPLVVLIGQNLWMFKSDPSILEKGEIYLTTVGYGLPFLLFFTTLQRYWQSRRVTKPILFFVLGANVANYFANKALIFGEYGFPELGIFGAAMATNISRCILFVTLLFLTIHVLRSSGNMNWRDFLNPFSLEKRFVQHLLKLGVPAGGQQVFEVGLFSLATILAAWLSPQEVAAHHVVIMIISFTYMFPVGLSSAAAYRVGHFVGANEIEKAKRAGWVSILIGVVIMGISAYILFQFPELVLGWFSTDPTVTEYGVQIVFWGAMFQVFDAIQACATGALRGFGNTKTASIVSSIGYYPIGLLLALTLCFSLNLRLPGLWIGLCTGLMFIALMLLWAWAKVAGHQMEILDQKIVKSEGI